MIAKLVFQLVLAVIPVYVLIESAGYARNSFDDSGGPAIFPRTIAWFFLGLLVIQMVRIVVSGIRKSQTEQKDVQKDGKKDNSRFDAPPVFWSLVWGTPGIVILASIAYALLVPILGFIIASSLFMVLIGTYLMYKADGRIVLRPMLIRSVAFIAFAVGIFELFMRAMRIYLPTGVFGF